MLHFTYDSNCNKSELMQGDVLRRTAQLDELLRLVHPHFFQNKENLFFLVLTQSCDLVRRAKGANCKAPYITIAAVRSLDLVVARHLAQQPHPTLKADMLVLGAKFKGKVTEFLTRLFNNNEPGYFYLDSAGTDLTCDCVAFLGLSIPIKADLHFDKCVEAKIAQLSGTFQAKLGWLVGQMYSRVGTEDVPTQDISRKTKSALENVAMWVDDQHLPAVEAAFAASQEAHPGVTMSTAVIKDILSKIKNRKQQVLAQTDAVLRQVLVDVPEAQLARVRKALENDAALSKLLK